jgi:flagellar biosynthesis protein FlhF
MAWSIYNRDYVRERSMVTKTFRAPNMLIALQRVQEELGPEAIVLSVREVPSGPVWQTWRKPNFEVIATDGTLPAAHAAANAFAHEADPGAGPRLAPMTNEEKSPASMGCKPPGSKPPAGALQWSWEPLVRHSSQPSASLRKPEARLEPDGPSGQTSQASRTESLPPLLVKARQQLKRQGVDEALLDRMTRVCMQAVTPAMLEDEPRLQQFMELQIEAHLKQSPQTAGLVPSRILVFVGLSGSGKTRACAKLASFFTLTVGKKVTWICADTVRSSAITEAQTFTDTLGIPLHLAYTPEELGTVVRAIPETDIVLIDTPACNPRREESVVELGGLLTEGPGRATYLVASATTKDDDLQQAVATLGPLNLRGLIVTKVDETATLGNVFNLAYRSQLPILYYSTSTQIMGGLRSGSASDLAAGLFRGSLIG